MTTLTPERIAELRSAAQALRYEEEQEPSQGSDARAFYPSIGHWDADGVTPDEMLALLSTHEEARQGGYAAGVMEEREGCARWHDARAAEYRATEPALGEVGKRAARMVHEQSAAAIRSRPSPAAPAVTMAEVVEVLRPFAEEAGKWEGIDDSFTPTFGNEIGEPAAKFTVGHLRAARALLSRLPPRAEGLTP